MATTDFSDQAVQGMTLEEAEDNARVWDLVYGELDGKAKTAAGASWGWNELAKAIKAETEAIRRLEVLKRAAVTRMSEDELKTSKFDVSRAEEKVAVATSNKMHAIEKAEKTERHWESFKIKCKRVRLEDPKWKSKSNLWDADV